MRLDPQPPPAAPQRIVLKFGGAGLADGERVRRACAIVAQRRSRAAPTVVVSAIGETTGLLGQALDRAERGVPDAAPVRLRQKRLLGELGLEPGLCNRHLGELETLLAAVASRGGATPAERDHVLSLGERMSARLFAAALRLAGVEATPVDAWDLGLLSDSDHGRARPVPGALAGVGRALARVPGVAVVTGFVAADEHGRLTTLGRSGSDLSAALLAAACGARELELWKTVAGMMSADPRLVPEARTLRSLSWRQAATLAFHGAGVVHPDALAPLERAGVPARVLDLDHPDDPGTRIGATGAARGCLGLACRDGLALVRASTRELESDAAACARLGATLASAGCELLALVPGPDEVALLTVDGPRLRQVEQALAPRAPYERGLALIAMVAAGPGEPAAAAGLHALERAGLAPHLAWIDSARATALWALPAEQLADAARALHPLTHSPDETPPLPRSTP